MSSIRVLVLGMSAVLGGVEREVLGVVEHCNDITFDFLCFTENLSYIDLLKEDSKIYYLPKRRAGLLKSNRMQKEFWKQHGKDYDVVWINLSSASNLTRHIYAKKYSDALIVSHSHGSKIEHKSALLKLVHTFLHRINRKRLVSLSDVLLTCSDKAGQHLYGKPRKPIVAIHNGVETGKFQFNQEKRESIRKGLGISEEVTLLGSVTRFVKIKNPFFLLQTFEKILQTDPKAKLLLLGTGPMQQEIEAYIAEKHIDNSVILAGFQSNVQDYLNAMDCFLLPSFSEGLPVVIVEAQANGLPCILSDTITREVNITDLVTYLPITKKDITLWANHSINRKSGDRSIYAEQVLCSQYDIKSTANQFINVVRKELRK